MQQLCEFVFATEQRHGTAGAQRLEAAAGVASAPPVHGSPSLWWRAFYWAGLDIADDLARDAAEEGQSFDVAADPVRPGPATIWTARTVVLGAAAVTAAWSTSG